MKLKYDPMKQRINMSYEGSGYRRLVNLMWCVRSWDECQPDDGGAYNKIDMVPGMII